MFSNFKWVTQHYLVTLVLLFHLVVRKLKMATVVVKRTNFFIELENNKI